MIKKTFSLSLIVMLFFSINGFSQKSKKQTKVSISTLYGDMTLVLYNETPKHRDNFIKLVKSSFYDGTLFHRVIAGFMIQGGDPDSKTAEKEQMLGNGGPGYTVPAEFNKQFVHKKGALSAARMGDGVNPQKSSSGSQFYIVQGKKYDRKSLESMGKRSGTSYTEDQIKGYEIEGGTPQLDMNYTVFGEVIQGFDVIDKIAAVAKGRADRPKEDVKMTMKIVK
ncbi:MAG: peptidylprolyl isomerase [Flavobacteriales bacterium]|jgi:peptidyl-prolyl cis-trans isomerase B (cyclophilin B)